MKIIPVTITVRNSNELDALRHALEVNIDIANDTLTEEIPYQPETIRQMAGMSDEDIKLRLKKIHEDVNRRSMEMEGLQSLLSQLNNADVISLETK